MDILKYSVHIFTVCCFDLLNEYIEDLISMGNKNMGKLCLSFFGKPRVGTTYSYNTSFNFDQNMYNQYYNTILSVPNLK